MKKICIVGLLVGICAFAQATPITVTNSLHGSNALEGNDAYEWGINIAPGTGNVVTSATLTFSNIKLTASGNPQNTGILYADILNAGSSAGKNKITTFVDSDHSGDFFTGNSSPFSSGSVSSLGSKSFSLYQTFSWSYTFDTAQLATLNAFLSDNYFAIGLDPDCYYNVGSICFTYEIGPAPRITTVPDLALTGLLLGGSLLGLELVRRRLMASPAK